MAKQQKLFFIALVASVLLAACSSDAAETVYDVLEKNNLPRGLLPNGVSYTLSPQGKLDLTVPGVGCTAVIQNYKMQFAGSMVGVIQPGSISQIHGLSLNVEYAWLGITRVERADAQINFYVQNSNKPSLSLPVSSFATSPDALLVDGSTCQLIV
jgi:hypothetical protein